MTLFGLVVYILLVSIVFSFGFNRFQGYPEEAERANFLAVQAQIKTGVNLAMINAIAERRTAEHLAGSNPMDMMLETPPNYVGELSTVNEEELPRRIWYFDRSSGELVYRANAAENLHVLRDGERVSTDEIRLEIVNVYDGTTSAAGGSAGGNWQGIQLRPVTPYQWQSSDITLPERGTSDNLTPTL